MAERRIVDIGDSATFALIPPCADPRFDHRTCDYWEDADRGSKHEPAVVAGGKTGRTGAGAQFGLHDNPFAPGDLDEPDAEPVRWAPLAPRSRTRLPTTICSPSRSTTRFAPQTQRERPLREGVPRKLALLDRGRGVFGSYAKVLLVDDEPVAYCQFGPLSAYPARAAAARALSAAARLRRCPR